MNRYKNEGAYSLLSWVFDMLICIEQRPYIKSLAPPSRSMNRPVKRKLQTPPVQRSGNSLGSKVEREHELRTRQSAYSTLLDLEDWIGSSVIL